MNPKTSQAHKPRKPRCSSCEHKTTHTARTWRNHPNAGHGYEKYNGWSRPELKPAEVDLMAALQHALERAEVTSN